MKGSWTNTVTLNATRENLEVAFESLQKPLQFVCTKTSARNELILKAKVAELADAPDLGSGG